MSSVNMTPNADTPKTPEQEQVDSITEINMRIDILNRKISGIMETMAFCEWEFVKYAAYLQELIHEGKRLDPKDLEENITHIRRYMRALEQIDSNLNRIMFYLNPES